MNKNRIGIISLSISITGLLCLAILIHFHILKGLIWNILLAGFEAGTIGGFADWFAVSALFREIPIPIIRRHTNIIVNNREKLTIGIVDLVTNKLLSSAIIKEKINDLNIIDKIVPFFKRTGNVNRVVIFLKETIRYIAKNIDDPDLVIILQSFLKDQLKDVDIGSYLGNWIKKYVKNGDHNQLWEMILESAMKTINDPSTQIKLISLIEQQLEEYKNEDFFKDIFISIAEGVGAIDSDSIVNKIINSMNNFVEEARGSPNHPFRSKFDANVLLFANNLIIGDKNSIDLVNNIKYQLINNSDANNVIQNILTRLKFSLEGQLDADNNSVIIFLKNNISKLIFEFEQNKSLQVKFDNFIKDSISQLASEFNIEIGKMIRNSIVKLNNDEIVTQIEDKVGNDLQYIRLNGAVVGGCIGIIIYSVQLILNIIL